MVSVINSPGHTRGTSVWVVRTQGVSMRSTERVVLAFALGGVLAGAAVEAQVLEEVIVTAQKREESLQDVGISVSAFSGDQLKALGVSSTVDITQQVPGLQLFTFSPAYTVFSLRGVSQNNFQDNLEAPVAVYMDGAYVASMNAINSQLFDMDRVEVLRGPQGTLFGRNARSEEHTSELQSQSNLVCRLLLEKKKK